MCNHYALSNPVASLQAPAPEQISQGSALHGTGVPSNTLTACRLACTQLYHFMLTYVCSCQYFSESIFIILSYFPTVSRELFLWSRCLQALCVPFSVTLNLVVCSLKACCFCPRGGFGSQEAAKTRSPIMCDKSCVEYPVWLWLWQDSCSYCHLCPEGNLSVQHYCSAKLLTSIAATLGSKEQFCWKLLCFAPGELKARKKAKAVNEKFWMPVVQISYGEPDTKFSQKGRWKSAWTVLSILCARLLWCGLVLSPQRLSLVRIVSEVISFQLIPHLFAALLRPRTLRRYWICHHSCHRGMLLTMLTIED